MNLLEVVNDSETLDTIKFLIKLIKTKCATLSRCYSGCKWFSYTTLFTLSSIWFIFDRTDEVDKDVGNYDMRYTIIKNGNISEIILKQVC